MQLLRSAADEQKYSHDATSNLDMRNQVGKLGLLDLVRLRRLALLPRLARQAPRELVGLLDALLARCSGWPARVEADLAWLGVVFGHLRSSASFDPSGTLVLALFPILVSLIFHPFNWQNLLAVSVEHFSFLYLALYL